VNREVLLIQEYNVSVTDTYLYVHEMSNCERDENGYVVDPITLDIVPEERVIFFDQLGVTFCFDIESLARDAVVTENYVNPINRQPLSEEVSQRIRSYNYGRRIGVIGEINNLNVTYMMYPENNIARLIVNLYFASGDIASVGLRDVCVLTSTNRSKSLYSMDLNRSIQDVIHSGRRIYVSMCEVEQTDIGTRMHKLYNYAQRDDIEWLKGFIPERYKVAPPEPIPADELDQKMIIDFATTARNNRQPVSDEYLIRGISRLLVDSRISAAFANSLENALSRRITMHREGSPERERWNCVLHIMYSHVVNPYNLSSSVGIQSLYHRDRWTAPTFTIHVPEANARSPVNERISIDELMRIQRERYGNNSPGPGDFLN